MAPTRRAHPNPVPAVNSFTTSLVEVTTALLKTSAQASLVIGLVLLVHGVGRKHLSPRVRYALWLLVVLRLALPTSLESRASVFQHTRTATTAIARAAKSPPVVPTAPAGKSAGVLPAPQANPSPARGGESPLAARAALRERPSEGNFGASTARALPWPVILSSAWLTGVMFLLGRIVWIPLRLNARLARQETAPSPAVFEILEQAKRSIGVNQVLPIVQSRAVQSPALLGFIRPWLLLPHGLVEKFTADELRLVFLHELAHLKRRDIAVNWLTTLLLILHWFNPLVWYAFARMRADREEACDELALAHARAEENRAYGRAIIKLLEGFARPPALPGLVGILEDQQHIKRRITMIAQFKRMIPWSASAAGLFLVLGIVTLTDAQTEKTALARAFGAEGPRSRTVLAGTSPDVYGSLAPDESAVAYIEWGDKGGHIKVRELATKTAQRIVSASEKEKSYEFPSGVIWSRDSKFIAYQWEADDGSISVRIVPRHGGPPRIISQAEHGSWATPVDWSLDGKKLVVEVRYRYTAPNPPTLGLLDIGSGELRSIGPEGAHARLSPDGRHVVCERVVEGTRDIFVLPVGADHSTRVTNWGSDEGCPIFSTDGNWILFSSNRRGNWDLWAIRFADGRPLGEAVPLKYNFGDHTKWFMASGGIAFTIASSGVDGWEASDVYNVDLTRPRGSELAASRVSQARPGRNVGGSYSPDGKKIAYIRWRGPSIENPLLCIQDVADGSEKVYDPAMRRLGRVFWSPDGQLIGMAGVGNEWSGGSGTYLFSAREGKRVSQRLKRENSELGFAGFMFSADGTEILASPRDGAGGLAISITAGTARTVRPDERPTHAVSVVKEAAEERLIYAAENGDKRVIAHATLPASFRSLSVSPNGAIVAYLLVANGGEKGGEELHVAAADGSWDRVVNTGGRLTNPGARLSRNGMSWDPDSAAILLTLCETLPGEIGVLENFLPAEKLAAK